MVTTDNFLSDTTLFIKKLLLTITDPILAKRDADSKFVLTEYPLRKVNYPIITITDADIITSEKFGMNVEHQIITIQLEIRVWARNVIERDRLSQLVINKLRSSQYPLETADTSLNESLFDAQIPVTTTNLSESGDAGIKSKLIFVAYNFELGE